MNEEFAQKFVDLLTLHPTYMKPCVSFGQDNDLVYCTVPATSTQGAISAEDKAKQARGGVQLVANQPLDNMRCLPVKIDLLGSTLIPSQDRCGQGEEDREKCCNPCVSPCC